MIKKHKELKFKIIKLVFVYTVFISLLAIAGTLYYHYVLMKKNVKEMAKNESRNLITLFEQLNSGLSDYSVRKLEREIINKLKQKHLTYIKFYKTSLQEIKTTNKLDVNRVFHLDINKMIKGEGQNLLDIGVNGVDLETILPIEDSIHKRVIGYLALGYKVPQEKLKKIKENVAFTLCLVVFGIVFIAVLLIPIIFKLNSALMDYAKKLIDSRVQTLMVLGKAISKRDCETGAHNYRVTLYSIEIAEKYGLDDDSIKDLIKGSFLHDVGKIAIKDSILLKPSKLCEVEFEEMKQHVRYGVEIIDELEWLGNARDVVRYHHERYDGSGYLEGLKGQEIPVNAMIFAIADVFDALTSKRPYKEPYSYEKSIEIMKNERGKHFNPEILDAFLEISKKLYNEISMLSSEAELKRKLYETVTKFGYFEVDYDES